jgi:amidophosphoribosyltransferase
MFRDSDIEVIAQMLSSNPDHDIESPQWEKRIQAFLHQSDGAYSLVIMTKDAIFGCRDHCGLRPLCIGQMKVKTSTGQEKTRYVLSSETCTLTMVGATYLREVAPGEIVRYST